MTFVPPPGYQPSYKPPLPYVASVPGGLWPGMVVYVQGVATPQPDWIRIDLAMSTLEEADIALHVSPRFRQGVSVFNTYRGSCWEEEQRRELSPLSPEKPFEMVISVTPEGYRILVNGTFYKEFLHRMPPEQVKTLKVKGDLELHSAVVMAGGAIPSHSDCNLPAMVQPPTLYPPVPFIATIPGGLIPKKTIIVKGFIPQHAHSFYIALRAGPAGDVVLHVSPRMYQANAVVRNSFLGSSWGKEERDLSGPSPFRSGRYFDLSIRCGNHRFKVFAEGQPLFDFRHRVPAGPHVNVLEIEGDVVLSYVHF